MTALWLYCISPNGAKFFQTDGSIPVNLANFRALVENGRIAEDDWWGVRKHYKTMAPPTDMFIYASDRGIVGLATIVEVKAKAAFPTALWAERELGKSFAAVRLAFNLHKCQELLDNPVPASVVRGWKLKLNTNVVDISSKAQDLYSRLGWTPSVANEPPITPEAFDRAQPPERVPTTTYRILRDTELARRIKLMHRYECQVCGHTIELPDGFRYAEAHHIQPLGSPHNGPDIEGNILCVCPNHHAEFDLGFALMSLSNFRRVDGHALDQKYVDYHNREIYKGRQL